MKERKLGENGIRTDSDRWVKKRQVDDDVIKRESELGIRGP